MLQWGCPERRGRIFDRFLLSPGSTFRLLAFWMRWWYKPGWLGYIGRKSVYFFIRHSYRSKRSGDQKWLHISNNHDNASFSRAYCVCILYNTLLTSWTGFLLTRVFTSEIKRLTSMTLEVQNFRGKQTLAVYRQTYIFIAGGCIEYDGG